MTPALDHRFRALELHHSLFGREHWSRGPRAYSGVTNTLEGWA